MPALKKQPIFRLAILCVLAAWFLVPLPAPKPVTSVEARRGPEPSSTVRDSLARLNRSSAEVTFRLAAEAERGGLSISLLDADGKLLLTWAPPLAQGQMQDSVTFSIGEGFPAGSAYFLRVAERDFVGTYKIDTAQQRGVTLWQRFLVLAVALAVMAAVVVVGFRPAKGRWPTPADGWSFKAVWFGFVPLLAVAYPLVHESGHAIALLLFGDLNWSRNDFLGIWGLPHAGRALGVKLSDWQEAVVAIAGPGLPILIGYLLLVLWAVRFGKKSRASAPLLDALWSTMIALYLFSIVGWVLSALGLVSDSDYMGFVIHIHAPLWVVRLSLGLLTCVNLFLVALIGRHLWGLRRQAVQHGPATEQVCGKSCT